MNVSYLWLRDYVKTDFTRHQCGEPSTGSGQALPLSLASRLARPVEVGRTLSRVGLNVETIEDLPGGDARLEVEVTSNRPDCLGHIGVARELAAALGTRITIPDAAYEESQESCADLCRVEVAEPDLCPLYTARVVRGVRVGPSPAWMRQRLEAVGVRPVNNIVDVTNYVMMECGQPLHAFDLAALADRRIVVRRAGAGERFIAIDHTQHTLGPERLVIAGGRRAVALAGVMGGAESEISDATRDLLLEAAVFDPLSIRTTARALGMASESSYRFERRVDPRGTDWASRRACQLILQAAGGRAARGACSAGKFTRRGGSLPTPAELTLRVARIEKVLGLAIPAETAAQILARLELEVLEAGPETIRVRVPSWRPDLEREIDLVEEVARHHGYEKVPDRPHIRVAHTRLSKAERVRQAVSEVLTGAGYFEAVSYSFTTGEKAARLAWAPAKGEPLALRGAPLVLRESVLVGLLDALRVNSSAGEERPRLFEIARRFVPKGSGLPEEDTMLALAAMDDFAGVKGSVEAVLERLRVGGRVRFAAAEGRPDLEPGESADLFLDGRPLGVLGRVTKEAAAVFGLDEPPTVAELIYDRLIEAAALEPQYRPCPAFPAIVRDLALVLDEEVAWETVEAAARAAGVAELESVRATEVYRGQQVPAGKKSLVIRLVLRRSDETLRHEDADAMQARVLAALQERVGAVLRK